MAEHVKNYLVINLPTVCFFFPSYYWLSKKKNKNKTKKKPKKTRTKMSATTLEKKKRKKLTHLKTTTR